MNGALRKSMTVAQFLAWEERQELRYEFDGFQPVAMTGGAVVVFEVLSPGTSRTDHIEKLREHEAMESIQRKVFLEQHSIAATVFVR